MKKEKDMKGAGKVQPSVRSRRKNRNLTNPYLYSALSSLVNPNLYLVLPGLCNALCSFCCFRKQRGTAPDDYLIKLDNILKSLPSNFTQITVLGGEPSISPYLKDVLSLLSTHRGKGNVASKVVLTTNASGLIPSFGTFPNNLSEYLKRSIDHVNISRHSSGDNTNATIFNVGLSKWAMVPDRGTLEAICSKFNRMGIDVSLNCVLHNCKSEILIPTRIKGLLTERMYDELYTTKGILHYLKFAKDIGASAVCFKKMESDSLEPTSTEKLFKTYKVIHSSKCPTCRSKTQLIAGMQVTWQAALKDKSSAPPQDLIFHPNGKLALDWKGKWIVEAGENIRSKKVDSSDDSSDDDGGNCSRLGHC